MADPITRRKQSGGTDTGTSLTVTFDEAEALSSDYLIVAVVQFAGTAAAMASNSWGANAQSGSAGNGSGLYLGLFTKRGDGSTNSFTINFGASQAQIAVCLMAFRYNGQTNVDATPITSNNTSATTATAGPATATPGTNRVLIAAVGLSAGGGGTWGTFSNGFFSGASQSRLMVSVKEAPTTGATDSTTVTWASARVSRSAMWTIAALGPASNISPTVSITPKIRFAEVGDIVTIEGSSSDTDGTIASHIWTQLSGPTVDLSGETTDTVSFVADTAGKVILRYTVTDDDAGTNQTEVTIHVAPHPWSPWRHTDGSSLGVKFFDGATVHTLKVIHPDGYSEPDGLLARWSFKEASAPFLSDRGDLPLVQGNGSVATGKSTSPNGLNSVTLNGSTNFLLLSEDARLNVGADTGEVTVVAWVKRQESNTGFIAGQWHEEAALPGGKRSYGLFNGLSTYSATNRVNGHVSATGGPTPGWPYSIDYSSDGVAISNNVWELHAMTYDGTQVCSYRNGALTSLTNNPGVANGNPYAYPDGLNPIPAEFTVGACWVSTVWGNFFQGEIALLAVYNKALSAGELLSIKNHWPA